MQDDAITSHNHYTFKIVQDPRFFLAKRAAKLRERAGLSQALVAERIGLKDRNAISRLEKGETWPEFTTLEGLADLFGVPVAYLLVQEEIDTPDPVFTPEQALKVLAEFVKQAAKSPIKLAPTPLAEALRSVTVNETEFKNIAASIEDLTGGRVRLDLGGNKLKPVRDSE